MRKYNKCSNISTMNLITRERKMYECSILIFIVPSTDVEAITNGDSSK